MSKLTNKPVVGAGRFTFPDAMVSQIKRALDLTGRQDHQLLILSYQNKIKK